MAACASLASKACSSAAMGSGLVDGVLSRPGALVAGHHGHVEQPGTTDAVGRHASGAEQASRVNAARRP
jgi:hypothetical protein